MVRLNVSASQEQQQQQQHQPHPHTHQPHPLQQQPPPLQQQHHYNNNGGSHNHNNYNNNVSNLSNNVSTPSSSTSSLNSNASSFEPQQLQQHHHQQQQQLGIVMVVPQQQQPPPGPQQPPHTQQPQQQQQQQSQQPPPLPQYAHGSPLQHTLQHVMHHAPPQQQQQQGQQTLPPPQNMPPMQSMTLHQHQLQQQHQQSHPHQAPPQHSPSDGSASSLPASPPLLQQTSTPPQGAQLVQPVCAVHHPQQHQQQQLALVAAMQQHLAATGGLGPPPVQQGPQGPPLPPPHMHHPQHHGPSQPPPPHGGPPAPTAQQQNTQHSQQLVLENGHGIGSGGGGGGGGGPGLSPSGSTGSSAASVGSAGSAVVASAPAPPPPPGPLYIQYPGEFYPTEYYIAPHPHDGMCPQHPHHHQQLCAMPTEYGPTTVQMVSQNRPPPMPVPVQVPQGQVMQQYVNESGTLTHVVLSPQQYQQLHTGQGHIHAPFLTANGTSHFYSPLPASYPPAPSSGPAHFHALPGGHMQPPPQQQQQQAPPPQQQPTPPQQPMSHSPHSPSPPNSYHKDERSQRQHTKLLRKLEKQREHNSAMSTPAHSPSPRRNDLNGHQTNTASQSNGSNVGNGVNNHGHQIASSPLLTFTTSAAATTVTSTMNNSSSNLSHHNVNHNQYHGQQLVQHQQAQQHLLNNHIYPARHVSQRNGSMGINTQHLINNMSGGGSSVGTSEDGEDNLSNVADDEEDYQASIVEQLSAIQKPEIIDLTPRSAKIIWEAPMITDPQINTRELRYNVLLSDRAKDCKYKSLYKGESYDCIVQDLQPGQIYVVRLQVHYEKLQGSPSEPTEFTTPPCEPDQPMPPKLVMRTKNSLHLRWINPHANGTPIQHYVLEYDEGKTGVPVSSRASRQNMINELHFVEATKTKGKHYILTKLQPSTVYNFRLLAINEVGPSPYSPICTYTTASNPPTAPKAPKLDSFTATTLRLSWERRQQDNDYVLQIMDRETGHGYLNAYNGHDCVHECCQLRRATAYNFRLRAENEAGSSSWSNEVTFKTAPERPGRPGKPHVKGKIHGTHFRARWDPPTDTGGADILRYFLEITSGSKFERIYAGPDTETTCDRLQPGTTYQLRASCEGPAGVSPFSDVAHITSEAIVPAAPPPPYYDNPPGPYAAVLRLDKPDYNGGAPILEFEVQLRRAADVQFDTSEKSDDLIIVYRGKDAYCVIKDLQPGCAYEVQVRALNRIGAGAWSAWFRFSAASAPPNCPENPKVVIKSATHLLISWQQPSCNGAAISEYHLESATIANDSESPAEKVSTVPPNSSAYQLCYQGAQTSVDLRNLMPFTLYYFRVNACNVAGVSKWSIPVNARTPAAVPAAPQIKDCEFTANEVSLSWTKPECNGSSITAYVIEYAERSITTEDASTEYTVTGLAPETAYKFRVQAQNAIGTGPYSPYAKFTTLPPPPAPPTLECTGLGHNFIKLKWGDGKNLDFTKYFVEMYVQRAKEFQIVYSGTNCMCKVNKLQERTAYKFRIYASTDRAGVGDYSEEYVFNTTATLPSSIKAPRVVSEGTACLLTHSNAGSSGGFIPSGVLPETPTSFIAGLGNLSLGMPLTLEWQNSKNTFSDRVEYVLQYAIGKEGDYRKIYRGIETKFTIENLEPGATYQFRVCPVRVTSSGEDLPGQFTSAFRYQVPHLATLDDIDSSILVGNVPGVFSGAVGGNHINASASCHGHSHHPHHFPHHPHHGLHHSHHPHNHSHNHSHHSSRQHASNLHHRSASASAVTSSSGNMSDNGNSGTPSTILLGHNAIGLIPLGTAMASELAGFAGCDDPNHHHHHHHHHQFHSSMGDDDDVGSTTTASILAATANSLLASNALLAHANATNHTQNGAIRRFVGKLTSVYTNRKRFTDQEKAVIFMISFLFFTFIFATLVKMFMR